MALAPAGFVMAFDYGLRHIGVALGQTVTANSRGIATINARQGKADWRAIVNLLDEYKPSQLVVGLPLNMDGSSSEMAERARAFGRQLARRSDLPMNFHDERLTTRAARSNFEEAKALGTAGTEHELAACLILNSWFEEQQTRS